MRTYNGVTSEAVINSIIENILIASEPIDFDNDVSLQDVVATELEWFDIDFDALDDKCIDFIEEIIKGVESKYKLIDFSKA